MEQRPVACDAVQGHVLGLVDHLGAQSRPLAGVAVHQVLLDLGLAVDADGLARQLLEVDAQAPPAERQLHAVVDEPLAHEPVAHPRLDKGIDRALLQEPGADARAQVLRVAPLEHHAGDAGEPEQPAPAAGPTARRRQFQPGLAWSAVGPQTSPIVWYANCWRVAAARGGMPRYRLPVIGSYRRPVEGALVALVDCLLPAPLGHHHPAEKPSAAAACRLALKSNRIYIHTLIWEQRVAGSSYSPRPSYGRPCQTGCGGGFPRRPAFRTPTSRTRSCPTGFSTSDG